MYEIDVQQQHEVTGGIRGLWKFIAENFVTEMGNGELYPDGYEEDDDRFSDEIIDYPGVGLPPR